MCVCVLYMYIGRQKLPCKLSGLINERDNEVDSRREYAIEHTKLFDDNSCIKWTMWAATYTTPLLYTYICTAKYNISITTICIYILHTCSKWLCLFTLCLVNHIDKPRHDPEEDEDHCYSYSSCRTTVHGPECVILYILFVWKTWEKLGGILQEVRRRVTQTYMKAGGQ